MFVTKSSRRGISLFNVAGLKSSWREEEEEDENEEKASPWSSSPPLSTARRTSGFAPLTNLACFSLDAKASPANPGVSFTTAAPRQCRTYASPGLMTASTSLVASRYAPRECGERMEAREELGLLGTSLCST